MRCSVSPYELKCHAKLTVKDLLECGIYLRTKCCFSIIIIHSFYTQVFYFWNFELNLLSRHLSYYGNHVFTITLNEVRWVAVCWVDTTWGKMLFTPTMEYGKPLKTISLCHSTRNCVATKNFPVSNPLKTESVFSVLPFFTGIFSVNISYVKWQNNSIQVNILVGNAFVNIYINFTP